MRDYRGMDLWKDVPEKDWRDWRWQVHNCISDVESLRSVINIDEDRAREIEKVLGSLRMAVSPYYSTLIDPDDPACPIRRQAVPDPSELVRYEDDMVDPLDEEGDSPTPGLTHRYPDRVLFLVTDRCTMYCRHCTRRRLAGVTDRPRNREEIRAAIDYIRRTPQVRDVLISGGDPLTIGRRAANLTLWNY